MKKPSRLTLNAFLTVVTMLLATGLQAQQLQVVTSSSIVTDLVEAVAGDKHKITVLVGRDGDPHVFQPSPGNAVAVANADLVFEMGLGFEPWMKDLTRAGRTKAELIKLSDATDNRISPGEQWSLNSLMSCCAPLPINVPVSCCTEEKAAKSCCEGKADCCGEDKACCKGEVSECCDAKADKCCGPKATKECCKERAVKSCCEGKADCCGEDKACCKGEVSECCDAKADKCCGPKATKECCKERAVKSCCEEKAPKCCESKAKKTESAPPSLPACCSGHSSAATPDHPHQSHADHSHGEYDPHLWLDIQNVIPMVRMIADQFSEKDPENAATYQQNADELIQRLWELDEKIEAMMAEIPDNRRAIITEHNSFAYFGKRYGLTIAADLLNSLSTENAEPSAAHVVRVVEMVRNSNPRVIFRDSETGSRLVQRVAREANAEIVDIRSGSLGRKGTDIDTYEKLMLSNASKIHAALTR